MDYHYEQSSEVEALDSIYYGDMQILETEPFHKFCIPIKSEVFDDGEGLACQLIFTYTAKYPDEVPIVEIEHEENFDNIVSNEELLGYLMEQAKENVGMVMVFTLVSAGQEWLSDKWDCVKRQREEKVLAKIKADEEAEQQTLMKAAVGRASCAAATTLSMSAQSSWARISSLQLCQVCLRAGHESRRCKLSGCRVYKRRHNTFPHKTQTPNTSKPTSSSASMDRAVPLCSEGTPPTASSASMTTNNSAEVPQTSTANSSLSSSEVRGLALGV